MTASRNGPRRAGCSGSANRMMTAKRSADGQRVMSLANLIAHLGTLARNTMRVSSRPTHSFTLYSKPTPLQEAAFRLLGLNPVRGQ